MSPCGPDGAPCAAPLVAAQIVENNDVAWGQGRREHLLDIGCEQLAIDRSVDHPERVDAEDRAPGVNLALMGLPACALERDVAAGLRGRQYGFL